MPTLTSFLQLNKPIEASPTDADLWGGQWNTNGNTVDTYAKSAYTRVNAMGNQSGTVTIDASLGKVITMTLTGNVTSLSFTNIPTAPSGDAIAWDFIIQITQDGTGGRTLTVPSSFRAPSGAGATIGLSTTAGAVDTISGYTANNGSTFFVTIQKNWAA